MEAFGISIEVSSRVLEFNRDDEFPYKEVYRVQQTSDGRIEFSLLLDIKQSGFAQDKYISVDLIHLLENSPHCDSDQDNEEKQRIRQMDLGKIELFNIDEGKNLAHARTCSRLRNDPWAIKQLIKWNCTNVPADGAGSYSIVTSVPSVEEPNKKKILDCCYFEVI